MISGPYPELLDYICEACDVEPNPELKFNTIAWLDSRGLKLVCLYNCWSGRDIQLHLAARPKSLWCHPEILKHMFLYPFEQLGCVRVSAPIRVSNTRMRSTAEKAGFQLEGICRQLSHTGEDVCLYGMLKSECRWIGAANGSH